MQVQAVKPSLVSRMNHWRIRLGHPCGFRFGFRFTNETASTIQFVLFCFLMALSPISVVANPFQDNDNDGLTAEEQKLVRAVEDHRIKAINKVIGSVIAIYDDGRQGGGSGVIIDPSGIALTNHHVIMGAGIEGWGGLADGKMYRWKLIGTDPGGDVSIIQMEGRHDFPYSRLGDSDKVRVGDWAMAMGNPFILTEDQVPTVTLGIVSGVKRYQPGAGLNQLEYGNCIQVDSSINPGNSGGPLFNLQGEVIGINGRGSFKERGRVNVGLGYAISANQIKNFIPDLLATKLVEHATLDAVFSERDGKVVCSTINLDAKVAELGVELGDELLEFESTKIVNANQFTNLICTVPEDWPIRLVIRKKDGTEKTIHTRAFGLPYQKPKKPKQQPKGKNKAEEEKLKRKRQMIELLAAPPGKVRLKNINRKYADHLFADWKSFSGKTNFEDSKMVYFEDSIVKQDKAIGAQKLWVATDGRFSIVWAIEGQSPVRYTFDGSDFYKSVDSRVTKMTLVEAKINLPVLQAISLAAHFRETPFDCLGSSMIHGGDKALGQVAYRFECLDEDRDKFYFWLQMYDQNGNSFHRLLKASADMDCDDNGGVVFEEWKECDQTFFPMKRRFVVGLAETTMFQVENKKIEWLDDFDEDLFEVNTESDSVAGEERGER